MSNPTADANDTAAADCRARTPDAAGTRPDDRPIASRSLLDGKSSVTIDHEGVSYVLRATRAGKLILTK